MAISFRRFLTALTAVSRPARSPRRANHGERRWPWRDSYGDLATTPCSVPRGPQGCRRPTRTTTAHARESARQCVAAHHDRRHVRAAVRGRPRDRHGRPRYATSPSVPPTAGSVPSTAWTSPSRSTSLDAPAVALITANPPRRLATISTGVDALLRAGDPGSRRPMTPPRVR